MPEATSKRDGEGDGERMRAALPPADTQPFPDDDREVENYRDEYDAGKPDRPRAVDDHRW